MDLTVIPGLKITLCFIVLPQAISIWYFSIEMDGQGWMKKELLIFAKHSKSKFLIFYFPSHQCRLNTRKA